MKKFKKLISLIIVTLILANSFISLSQVVIAQDYGELTEEEIQAKNYPVPEGYQVKTVLQCYDEYIPGAINVSTHTVEKSTEEGTFYDGASMKFSANQNYREIRAFASGKNLDGDGFMFWYKSNTSVAFRLRTVSNNKILNYGNLPASPDGSWVYIYYYGKTVGFNYNSSSVETDYKDRVDQGEMLTFNIMSTNSSFLCYIDEFITFEAPETENDVYEDDNTFFKYSLAKLRRESNTIAEYGIDGSVILSSTFGSTAKQHPINITYDVDSNAVAAAIAKAQQGTGYLQVSLDNISCQNASQTGDQGLKFTLIIEGVNKPLIRYNYEVGTVSTYIVDVSDITNPEDITSINVKISAVSSSALISNIQVGLSPITVYELPENSALYEAEDFNPIMKQGGQIKEATVNTTEDGISYALIPTTFNVGDYLEITIPNTQVGEYDVYARTLDNTGRSTFMFTANALRPIKNIDFGQGSYSSNSRHTLRNIGNILITKSGDCKLRFTVTTKNSTSIYLDHIILQYIGPAEEEPASNFVIKDYPAMDNHEVKTILNTFNDFICGTDPRWTENQVYGYVGEGTAFNLNSRGTVNKTWFDNNNLVSGVTLDGDGIRFWYKATSSATLQFCQGGTVKYSKSLAPKPNGEWVNVYYTDVVANGDMTGINRIALKTSGASAYYVDELHTIQEKIGTVLYQVDKGVAKVVGYDLRLENVEILSEYEGCPVVSIEPGAFKDNKTLKSVVLPSTLQSIGAEAFSGCLNLQSLTLNNGLTTIGENAFYNCQKLTEVVMPNSLSNIHPTAFSQCDNIVLVVQPDSYPKNYAIANNVRFKCYTEDGYDYIYNNQQITIINYSGTDSNLIIPSTIDGFNVTEIAENAFKGNETLISVVIPDTVMVIGNGAFEACTALENVTVGNYLGCLIGNSAFKLCSSLTEVNLGTGVTTIEDEAFKDCNALEELYLPNQITFIADNTFSGCDNLIVSMEKDTYVYTYVNSHGLKYIPVTTSKFKYSVVNYKATIIAYTGSDTEIVIPSQIDDYTVVAVGEEAFINNQTITSVVFSDTITLIDVKAFYGCSSLADIDFGEVRKINAYAFAYCTALTEVTLLDLVDLSVYAFEGCPDINIIIEETQFLRNAFDFVKLMTVGWNLGNTFDSFKDDIEPGTITPTQSEKLWGAPVTTQEMIDEVAQAGFNTIRIPITWQAFLDENYNIDPAYIARIKEVVGYAYNNNMFVIINLHHDTWVDLSVADFEALKTNFGIFWANLAEEFKFYDEKLIFEAMNEVRYAEDWYGHEQEYFDMYNELHQIFYDVVRNSGGLNDKRYLMLETYAAQYKSHQIPKFWLPENDDHIIASVHMYINTLTASHYTPNLERIYNAFIAKNIPCVIGEVGIPIWYDEDYCAQWATFFLNMCKQYQLKCIFWDDHGNYNMLNRSSLTWQYPAYIQAIKNATRHDVN